MQATHPSGSENEPGAELRPGPPRWRRLVPSWLRRLIWVDEVQRYDAFLSYTWAIDREVAEAVQAILQDFLCPWYKMREKTVFREPACLPAGVDLLSSISASTLPST